MAEVARLGPELLEVRRVGHGHALVEHREGVHPHGAVAEPRARWEAHPGHLREGVALLGVQPLVHVATAAGLDGVDDLVETVAQDPLGVHAHAEHVRDGHRRPDDVRNEPVPHTGGVLGPADRAEPAAAAPVGVAVGPVVPVHLGGDDAGVLRGRGVGPVGGDGGVDRRARAARGPPAVRLEEVGPARDREPDLVLFAGRRLREVLAVGHRRDVLEEPSLVLLRRREVDREQRLGLRESSVDVAVAHREIAPLVDVDVRLAELVVASSGSALVVHGD